MTPQFRRIRQTGLLAPSLRQLQLGLLLFSSALLLCFTSQPAFAADPIAYDDNFSTGSGQTVTGLLSGNDEFLDGPADNYAKLSDPGNGIAAVNSDGSFSYTPNAGFAGIDSFIYEINDGAGGNSSAQVNITVAAASNFLSSASSVLFTPEDTQVPLGLSVAPDLFDGGALQDLIATDALFRSDSAGATPVLSNIPAGASSVSITGYSTQSRNTAGNDLTDDDYQLLNARIDLVSGTSSGRVAFINHGRLTNLDQYSWQSVPLGQSVLSDPAKVVGFYATGDSDPTFSVAAGSLQIVETHQLETAYVIEYMTSDGDSTNFLGAGNSVQNAGESSSTLTFPAALEPATTKKGFIALNATSAAATGSNSAVEHKGFARLLIDFDTQSISGSIAAQRGESAINTVTYSFENYPLIDQRISSTTPVSILSSSATVVGDSTANASVTQDPTLYIDAGGQLVIERAAGFAAVFTSMYTAEYYERTGYSSIASTVSVGSADALFDTNPVDGVDEFGDPIDEFVFEIPASAHVGLLQMSWDTIGGSDVNENVGLGFAVIDLQAGISSGSMTFIRTNTPDLLSWDAVPLGSPFFGTTDGGGNPLYQSNKTAGLFTDPFVETAKFVLDNNPDGSRTLTFSATSTGGTQDYRDYRGNASISWLGNEPFSISGVPTQGLLSHGSPDGSGGWEIDFADIPLLAYQPAPHESGSIPLSFTLSSTGETENIELRIEPVVDAPLLSASDVVGYVNNAMPLNIAVTDSADTDGSETQPAHVTLANVPASVTLSATAGTVSQTGPGEWQADRLSLSSLTANATAALNTSIAVSVFQTDQKDVDEDLVIEDNDNGNGVDEYDELLVSDSFTLLIQPLPTVTNLLVNNGMPIISGTAPSGASETLTVSVNGVAYTDSGPDLVVNGDGTWMLSIPATNTLPENTYSVTAEIAHTSGTTGSDTTSNELVIDLTPPPVPGVTSQTTMDNTPVISGTLAVATGNTLTVSVNGVTYTQGDGHLFDNGDGTWDLQIPTINSLPDALYQVIATLTDAAGNASTDNSTNELLVDTLAPPSPGVTSQSTNDTTPVIEGTATLIAGDILRVVVNSITYTVGDGRLVDNADGSWTLTIPLAHALTEAVYDVSATITDAAMNVGADPSSNELTVDLTAPASPTVTVQLTNQTTPTLTGTATVGGGETLSVIIDGVTYTVGDGYLFDNGDGTWMLTIPIANALSEGILEVTATVTDAAGNSTSDSSTTELEIDLTPPTTPTVVPLITASATPVITGAATISAGDILSVEVDSVVYVAGDSNLIDNGDGSWTLTIPAGNALSDGSYEVQARVSDAAGNVAIDTSSTELVVDLTPPPAPGVTSQTTNDSTPLISGTTIVASGTTLRVEVNSTIYVAGDGNLMDNGDGTWDLTIPTIDTLADALYQVIATLTDAAGNVSTDAGVDELLVDTMAPPSPGVTSLTTNDTTPLIEGTAIVALGETLTVTVNTVTYTAGDGNLNDNADGTWALSIPASNTLAEATYDVSATITDIAFNTSTDPSSDELTVDLTAPVAPTVDAQLSNTSTPTLSGTATVAAGETLSVTVNGETYIAGDGSLIDNGDGTWMLTIPDDNELLDGSYTVAVITQDAAGNVSSRAEASLLVDTVQPALTASGPQQASSFRPALNGTAAVADGSVVQVRDTVGNLVCESMVTNSIWSCAPAVDLAEGETLLSATVADAAGNIASVDFVTFVSLDFDGDGIPNVLEGFGDSDGDGIADSVDLDADNDGLPDSREGTRDSDQDGLPDYLDEDADNDGIADLVEALGTDDNGDFLVDNFIDNDGNGLSDALQIRPLPAPDTDGDGIPDFLDVDSDQDGIPDLVETLGSDVDDNGRIDDFRDLDANGVDDAVEMIRASLIDSDGDGVPDYRDLDSDNDGIMDLVEAGGADADNDGIVDTAADSNSNGIPDSVDVLITNGNDIDGDGIDDLADASITFGDDSDGDGIVDEYDPDSDGDGRADGPLFDLSLGAALPDSDPDGTPDFQQAGTGVLRTGLSGRGGCSITTGSNRVSDPTLAVIALIAFLTLAVRSQRSGKRQQAQRIALDKPVTTIRAKYAATLAMLFAIPLISTERLQAAPYLGVGVGQSLLEPDASELAIELQDNKDRSFSALLGLDLSPRLAVELAYDDLGQAQLSNDVYVNYRIAHASVLFRGFNERMNLQRRLGFSLFGRVGVGYMNNSANFPYIREHDTSLMFGGGAEFGFSNGLALRADLASFDTDAHRLGIFLIYRPASGNNKNDDNLKTLAPTQVTAARPTVSKQPIASTITTKPVAVSNSEFAILFDLNSSFTDFKAKVTAVNVAARMRHAPSFDVRLTGYTDISGTAHYNRWLADRRIRRVSELLQLRGVDESRIETVVSGESTRFGSADDDGLEDPNRRVQIELFER